MPKQNAIKVAILWHMHQPDYREPGSNRLTMPWVRLHAIKDYLDMPLSSAAFDNVKVTYNLVPSLLDQLELYAAGGTDRHLELSRIDAEQLNPGQKLEILDSFFAGHAPTMINPYPEYHSLFEKLGASAGRRDILPSLFSSHEIRDLQVWSNLSWVDPAFRSEEPVKTLFARQRDFTEADKHALLDWQINLIKRIIPTYRELLDQGRIDISFTPYYHPILPLLCDTDVAREALPGIRLPRHRFTHPEDAEHQVTAAIDKYRDLFGRQPVGMWPSEGSVSEDALRIMARCGIQWVATDEEILHHSLAKSNMNPTENHQHLLYRFDGVNIFFRDHRLSDRIGFVYSGWNAAEAVHDFVGQILRLRESLAHQLDNVVVPVILDGENAWEYFPDDGTEFLETLYRSLNDHPDIETVSMSEASASLESRPLPTVFAGSWINHNFRIWIGHAEDNAAWDLLSEARDRLVQFEKEHPDFDRASLKAAWRQIYIAEGSDWCWWYGDEHIGGYNQQFDDLFRQHLRAVYLTLGLEPPLSLLQPIHKAGVASFTTYPVDILTAQIDGRITHFYEWAGAGYFDCLKVGGAMHRVERHVSGIHFAFDHNRLYIRLDFRNKKSIESMERLRFKFGFYVPGPVIVELQAGERGFVGEEPGRFRFAMDDIMELAVERSILWPDGYGPIGFTVSLLDGDSLLENWPEEEPIQFEVPEKNKEIFWPS